MSVKNAPYLNGKPVSLVSGAGGFLGSHLVDRLIKAGHFVVGIDSFNTGSLDNLDHALSSNNHFILVQADITEDFQLPNLVYDYIWHLASPASPVDYRRLSIETMLVNSNGTGNMLKVALKNRAKFLLASTSEVYGDPLVHPQPEIYWGNVNSVGERACYDESKRFAEALVFEYHRRYSMNIRIVRIFNTYGPRMRIKDGRVVPNFICQALKNEALTVYGSGSQTRSFAFVDDEIEGIFRAMTYENTNGQVINLGNPEEYTVKELASVVAAICSVKLQIKYGDLPPDDPSKRCPDISRAKELLKWYPSVPLKQGIGRTVEYFAGKYSLPI